MAMLEWPKSQWLILNFILKLDCPHYTRPAEFQGMGVPEVLTSGNHAAIAEWRLEQALRRTLARRPDLLVGRDLLPQEARLLEKIQKEQA